MFPTQFSPRSRVTTNPGDAIKIIYSPKWRDDGNLELVETGSINVYDEIQSHKDSVDINIILAKYAKTGDISILNKARSEFMDVAGLPTSMAGFFNLVEDGRRIFDSLSVEDKSLYDNSFEKFIFKARTHMDKPIPIPTTEVIDDVSK